MQKFYAFLRFVWVPALCALIVLVLLNSIFIIGFIPSASMEPTINAGSYIFGLRFNREYERGDVVIFRMGQMILVKRIAAVSGDTVCNDFVLSDKESIDVNDFVVVPEECFFLLGDNADESFDSRFWAEPWIGKKDIVGYVPLL